MKRFKFLVFLICLLLALAVNSQILNGGFEDWEFLPDSSEYPVNWHAIYQNENPLCVTKSNKSYNGLFSVGVASLNHVEGTYAPGSIITKYSPTTYDNNLSFYYVIDSIDGLCDAVIQIFQKNNQGHYAKIIERSYNEILPEFTKKEIQFHLDKLDSLLIRLIARNDNLMFGYDGFIRVLFDDVELESVTNTYESSLDEEYLYYPNPSSGLIYLKPEYTKFKTYRVYSVSGIKLQEGILDNQSIELEYNGLLIIKLLDESNSITNLRVLNISNKR
jgi:hypothetical protein